MLSYLRHARETIDPILVLHGLFERSRTVGMARRASRQQADPRQYNARYCHPAHSISRLNLNVAIAGGVHFNNVRDRTQAVLVLLTKDDLPCSAVGALVGSLSGAFGRRPARHGAPFASHFFDITWSRHFRRQIHE